jgi:uncharacterized protein (DUF362 family)/Pyruvate/2-oxoacid:ferredoxin oxidoreductase delta subunit
VVRAAIKILKEYGCKILVGDSPSVFGRHIEDVDKVYEISGIKKVCIEEGVELVKFEKKRWRGSFPLVALLDDCDCIVSIPKFKTHNLTMLTGAVKNLFGLVAGVYKTELHKNYFHPDDFGRMLVDIFEQARPALTIIDGIVAMEGDGPATAGSLRQLNLLMAGADCVALDTIMALIMGLRPLDVPMIREAAKRGLGASDSADISVLGEELQAVIGKPFKLPSSSLKKNLPRPIINLAKKLVRFYPYVVPKNCIKCTACIKACPVKVISMEERGITFDYSGCIACFCCQEACPASAIKARKSVLAKLIGL